MPNRLFRWASRELASALRSSEISQPAGCRRKNLIHDVHRMLRRGASKTRNLGNHAQILVDICQLAPGISGSPTGRWGYPTVTVMHPAGNGDGTSLPISSENSCAVDRLTWQKNSRLAQGKALRIVVSA